MATSAGRGGDRRQVNVKTPQDRRGSGAERRKCPECKTTLTASTRTIAGGSVITLSCENCGWERSSRQTDAEVLMARMTWGLPLEKKAGGWSAAFPAELADSLKLKPGDELILSPLTLPVGSLPMRWALTVNRKTPKKR